MSSNAVSCEQIANRSSGGTPPREAARTLSGSRSVAPGGAVATDSEYITLWVTFLYSVVFAYPSDSLHFQVSRAGLDSLLPFRTRATSTPGREFNR
jgi:hypothetical protein